MADEYLGAMRAEVTPASPLEEMMRSEASREQARFGAAATMSIGQNPDHVANARKAAAFVGAPPEAALAAPAEMERQARIKKLDVDTAQAPALRSKYADRDFMALAHDDSGVLSAVEKAVRGFFSPSERIQRAPARVMSGKEFSQEVRALMDRQHLDADTARALLLSGTTIDDQHPLMGEPRGPKPTIANIFRGAFNLDQFRVTNEAMSVAAADALGLDNTQAIRRYGAAKARADRNTPEFETATGKGIYSGIESTVRNAPGIALSVLSGNPTPGLAIAGAQTTADAYGKYRERGATGGQAATGALLEGAVEVGTEMLPMSFLVRKMGKAGASEFIKGLLAREIPGEQLATVAQDAVDTAIANPDKTWGDFVRERPGAAYQTLLATLVQSGTMGAVNTVATKIGGREQEVRRAEESAARAQEFAGIVEQSKLRQRDPQAFQQFVAQAAQGGESPTEFYVDAQQLANTLNQGAVTMEEFRAMAPEVAAQLDAAKFIPGADIRVPVHEFAAAPAEITTALLDHLRETPEAMSRAEAQAFIGEQGDKIKQDVEQTLAENDRQTVFKDSVDKASVYFETQLQKVGKFRPEVNRAYATVLGNFYATQAERAGMSVDEFMDRYQLRIASKEGAGAQRLEQPQLSEGQAGGQQTADAMRAELQQRFPGVAEALEQSGVLRLWDGFDAFNAQTGGQLSEDYRGAQGMYLNGVAHLFGDGVAPGNVVPVFLHEVGEHASMKDMLGARYPQLVRRAYQLVKEGDPTAQAALMRIPDDTPRKFYDSEMVAYLIEEAAARQEQLSDGFRAWAEEVMATIRAWLYEKGVTLELNAQDIVALAVRAVKFQAGQERTAQVDAQPAFSMNQGDGSPRGTLSFGNDITAVPSIIALLENADLSTFLHESGHLFLEVQADLAARVQQRIFNEQFTGEPVSASERQIAADMEQILGWFSVQATPERSALDTWAGMTLEEKREHHEKWARGFERYLMEGHAPSQELQSLFSKFRAWMVSVYKALAGLNVELTDEVRQVMDRMLASDEAIAQAQSAREMGPLFQSPEAAGMTPEEYAAYQGLTANQTAEAQQQLDKRLMADMKWLSRARDKAMKARQDEVEDLRREVRMEITTEVMSTPVYIAWQILTGKGEVLLPGTGAAITPESSLRLRTKLVKEISAEAWSRLSERRMTSEDRGWDPDLVAEALGFTSGDQLVNQLARVPPPKQVIEEMVDQQMLERYGDITSPQALERAADEAVHNEIRARVVATELKALEKATTARAGPRSTIDVMARAAKDYAYQIIARQRVRDLRPSQYSAAQARSAKLAAQSLGKSTEEAAMHKRNELINGYAARAAYDAQEEVRALRKYMRKFDKRIDSIDPGYQDQIEALLERFDFKPASLKAVDRRKSFRAWYDEQVEAGNAPDVPDELLEDSARKSYKDMTVEDLRGLRDTIKQIEHQGRLKKKLLLARDARDFDAIATAVADSIVEHGGDKRPVELEGPNPVADWFAGVWASHRKLSSLFRQMDGNNDQGPLYQFIGREMNERSTMEDVMLEQATVKLRALYDPLTKLRGGLTGYRSKVFIPEVNASLTRGGRLAVALNWGNEANRQRIMDGNRWSVDQVQAVLKTLTPQELAFVNQAWEYLDSYWPEIAAKEKRITGVEPPKVEAAPFNVALADGSEVAMRGGYYPLKYDTNASDRAEQQEAAQVAKEMMQGAFTKATTRRGHTKERLKEVKRKVRLDLNVITQHTTQVVHDLAWHEWLIDTNKLLGDERIASAIREHYGPKTLKTIRDDVLGIATSDVVPQTDVDKALLALRGNVTRATMGASLTTAFLQPFGLTQSIVRIGGRHVLRGLARWGGDATRMESAIGWIHERSEFMRLRAKTFNRELREIKGSVEGKSRTMQVVDAGLFVLMQKMQMVADVPTWLGQYEKSKAEGLSEADAIAMADRMVLESQGGGATKDMAEVQRKHPMLTQFYSYFSVTLNLAAEQTAATDFKSPAAVAGWLGDMALLMVIPAILPSFILYALRGGDDDEEGLLKKVVEWQVSYLLGSVVGLRELTGAVSGFDYAGPPVGRLIADIGKAGKQTAQGEVDEPMVLAYVNLLGTAFGIPTVQALRSYKGWKAWDEGKEGAGPQSVLLGPPPKD